MSIELYEETLKKLNQEIVHQNQIRDAVVDKISNLHKEVEKTTYAYIKEIYNLEVAMIFRNEIEEQVQLRYITVGSSRKDLSFINLARTTKKKNDYINISLEQFLDNIKQQKWTKVNATEKEWSLGKSFKLKGIKEVSNHSEFSYANLYIGEIRSKRFLLFSCSSEIPRDNEADHTYLVKPNRWNPGNKKLYIYSSKYKKLSKRISGYQSINIEIKRVYRDKKDLVADLI